MKTELENTQDRQPATVQRIEQESNNGGTATIADNRPSTLHQRRLQETMRAGTASKQQPVQRRVNKTGLPDHLKTGIENLSGYPMDDVKVHYNSSKPAQLQAHAYAQGTDIHLAPNQEKHLPHEAWHVVQQKQGRVKPTTQLKGKVAINDDAGLEKEADVMGAKANESLSDTAEQPALKLRNGNREGRIIQRHETEKERKERERLRKRRRRQQAKGYVVAEDEPVTVERGLHVRAQLRGPGMSLRLGVRARHTVNTLKAPKNVPPYKYTAGYKRNLEAKAREITQHSGIVPKDITIFSDFAVQNDSVVMLRNVNPRAGKLLQRPDVIGKPMTMKRKSSNGGKGNTTFDPTKGFIPRNQHFSKIPLHETKKIAKYQRLVETAIAEEQASASQLTTQDSDGNTRYWYYVANPGGTYDFVFKESDDSAESYFLDKATPDEGEADAREELYTLNGGILHPLQIMGDPKTGKRYTADYDTLIFAVNADREMLNFKALPNNRYQVLDADKALRKKQEELLHDLMNYDDPRLNKLPRMNELRESLKEAHRLQHTLNEIDNRPVDNDEIYQGFVSDPENGDHRKEIVKDLTKVLRTVYTKINEVLAQIKEDTEFDGEDYHSFYALMGTFFSALGVEFGEEQDAESESEGGSESESQGGSEFESEGDAESEIIRRLVELQTSIEDTDLETPDLSNIRGIIFEDEEAAIVHLNKATDRATWHGPETNNKGGSLEDLYNDLKGGVVVFSPDGDIELIRNDNPEEAEKTLVERINVLREQGYAIFPNPRWGWRVNDAGKLYIPRDGNRIDLESLNNRIKQINGNSREKRTIEILYDLLIIQLEKEYAQDELFKGHWNESYGADSDKFIRDDKAISNGVDEIARYLNELLAKEGV